MPASLKKNGKPPVKVKNLPSDDLMPRILLLADTHAHHRQIEPEKADIFLVAGDYSMRSREDELLDFLIWLREHHEGPVVLVCGNHDRFIWHQPQRFHQLMEEFEIQYLENSELTIKGVRIWGSSVMPPILPGLSRRFELDDENERGKIWAGIPEGLDILMTHCPPAGIMDFAEGSSHGCQALGKRIAEVQPAYHLFGHIHQGYGQFKKDRTCFVNGALSDDGSRKIRHKPFLLELPDGLVL